MAVRRQQSFLAQMRCDVPFLRAIESAVTADFDLLAGTILANRIPAIVSGFNLISTGITQPQALQIQVANSVLLHYYATEAGTIFQVPADRAPEVLSNTNPKIRGSFLPGQTNYVGLDFTRTSDPATTDAVQFFDPEQEAEVTKTVPLARTLDYTIVISASDFDSNIGLCPLAKVVLDGNGGITSVQDARNILWRLGTGGSAPNVQNTYSWPAGRDELTSGDPFLGGDKAIGSMKSWMDAMMTRVWELGGGEFWYSPTQDHNVVLARTGATFSSNGEYFEWTGSNLHWQGLTVVFANSTGISNTVADQATNSAGLTDLADGECIYVDLDRTQNRSGGTALQAAKTSLALLGTPSTPGSRWVLAWRYGSSVFTRDQSYAIGSAFKLATDTASGAIKLSATVASLDNGADPRVAAVDAEGTAYATGITRGGPGFGGPQGVLFGALGAGTLTIGGGTSDTGIAITANGPVSVGSADGAAVTVVSRGTMDISTSGGSAGAISVSAGAGNINLAADINAQVTARAVVEKTQTNNYSLGASANLAFTNNVNFVFVSGGNTHLSFITIAPWGVGSRLYLRLGTGVIVNNNAGGPPGGSASILLSTTNPQRGPTTNTGSMLELIYDGVNWVEPGVF